MAAQSIRRLLTLTVILALAATSLASPAGGAEREPGKAPYIVVFEDSVGAPVSLARTQADNRDAKLSHVYRHGLKGYAAKLTRDEVEGLRSDSRVKFVSRDHRLELFAQQTPTGVERVFAASNARLDIDQEDDLRVDVDVAVIDSGVDHEHPDLDVVGGADCAVEEEGTYECEEGLASDYLGHGTHVAGTIGAIDNGEGVVGVAPGARLWSVRVDLAFPVETFESSALAGVDWVTATRTDEDPENDIEVANMSFGCTDGFHEDCESLPALEGAISSAVEEGIVMVAAAGNESTDAEATHPASHPDVITVSAIEDLDGSPGEGGDPAASFSNHGETVEIAAPGVEILSTIPSSPTILFPEEEDYASAGGTSAAAPHVTGAAAILASQDPPVSKADVEAIRATLVEEGNSDWEDTSEDGVQEPLLDVGDEEIFDPANAVAPSFELALGSSGTGDGQFTVPVAIDVDSGGDIWVVDVYGRIQRFDADGEYLSKFGAFGSGEGSFNEPLGITFDDEDDMFIADRGNDQIQKFNLEGEFLTQFGEEGPAEGQLDGPAEAALDAEGNIWVVETWNERVQKFSPEGQYLTQFGEEGSGSGQFNMPTDIAIDQAGNIYIADRGNHRIQKFTSEGQYLTQFGEEGSGSGQFILPTGVAVDSSGAVYVGDGHNHRIQKFTSEGQYLTQFGEEGSGSGQFEYPGRLAIDAEGDLWITDGGNARVQKWGY